MDKAKAKEEVIGKRGIIPSCDQTFVFNLPEHLISN
jgi:hypothetical protein